MALSGAGEHRHHAVMQENGVCVHGSGQFWVEKETLMMGLYWSWNECAEL